jgi:hypothetical protein
MPTTAETTSRTARLLALMKKGDDAFNARDFATVDTIHHPELVAHITGLSEPSMDEKPMVGRGSLGRRNATCGQVLCLKRRNSLQIVQSPGHHLLPIQGPLTIQISSRDCCGVSDFVARKSSVAHPWRRLQSPWNTQEGRFTSSTRVSSNCN